MSGTDIPNAVTVTRAELATSHYKMLAYFVYDADHWKQLLIKTSIPNHPAKGEGSMCYVVSTRHKETSWQDLDNAIEEYNKL
jgi:hypothetical protein